MKVEPRPGRDSTRIAPPAWRTMPYTVARPRPVPVSLVVKNGSKMRERISSVMPQPPSFTESDT